MTYHGNPASGDHKFYVYPKGKPLQNPMWDFRINPCNNSKKISGFFASIDTYECLGHSAGQETITKKSEELGALGKFIIGFGVAALGAAVAAGGIALAQHLEKQKYIPCSKCEEL